MILWRRTDEAHKQQAGHSPPPPLLWCNQDSGPCHKCTAIRFTNHYQRSKKRSAVSILSPTQSRLIKKRPNYYCNVFILATGSTLISGNPQIGPDPCNGLLYLSWPEQEAATARIGPDSCDGTCYWSWTTQTASATRLDISLVLRRGSVRRRSRRPPRDGQRRSRPEFAHRLPVSADTCNRSVGIATTRQFKLCRSRISALQAS